MFIYEHSCEKMMWGISNYFNITIKDLLLLFEKIGEEFKKNKLASML